MAATARGFTLVELVTVIALLALIAVYSLPRFVRIDQSARIAAIKGLEGSLHEGAALAHAVYLVQDTRPASVTVQGVAIALTNGYPSATSIDSMLVDTSRYTKTTAGSATGTTTWREASATRPAACEVTYTPPASLNTEPTLVVKTAGC
jgi:MSHA pilin protein MshA